MKSVARVCLGIGLLVFCGRSIAWAGNVCTWQGGSGKFSDANWDVAPVSGNGDTIVIDSTKNDNAPIVLENDLPDDFEIAKIKFISAELAALPGKVTLNGRRLRISAGVAESGVVCEHGGWSNDPFTRGPELEVNMPLRLTGGTIYLSANSVFNGNITIDGTGAVRFKWPYRPTDSFPKVTVNGDVIGPEASINNCLGQGGGGSELSFYGHLKLKTLCSSRWENGKTVTYICSSSNEVDTLWFQYGHMRLVATHAVLPTAVVQHGDDLYGPGTFGLYSSAEQVIDVLESVGTHSKAEVEVSQNHAPTLVMKASRNATFDGIFKNGLSLVYNPQGPFTYTLASEKASTMTGSVTVRGGTLAFKNAAAFTAARLILVESGATLDFTDSTAAAPIGSAVQLSLLKGAHLAVPVGKTLALESVLYGGVPVAAGTYSDAAWLTGGGSVSVARGAATGHVYWSRPMDGSWQEAANWTPTAPTATDIVHISAEAESPYAATLGAGEYSFAKVLVGTERATPATLRLEDDADETFFTRTAFNVLKGGVWEQTAGLVTISNAPSRHYIENGGVWRVSGGTNIVVAKNIGEDGGFVVPRAGGEIQVTQNGRLVLRQLDGWVAPTMLAGGVIRVSESGELDLRNEGNPNANGQHNFGYGTIEVGGNGVMRGTAIGNGSSGGRFSVILRDNAYFDFYQNILAGFQKGADVYFDFGTTNVSGYLSGQALFGVNYRSRCEVVIRKGTRAPSFNGNCVIGGFMGSAGFTFPATASEFMPTGVVTVAGRMRVYGQWANASSTVEGLCVGSTVGQMSGPSYGRTTTWPVGTLTIEPTGSLTNVYGGILLGSGYGEGTIAVRGGRLVKSDTGVVVLGGGAGLARLTVTEGGTFTSVKAPVHVGGFNPADYNRTWSKYPIDDLSSTSRIDVVDGTLDFSNVGVTVGAYGTAFLSVGTNGLVRAKNLALDARVETELAFTVGAEGCGRVAVSDTLTIANGARLAITVQSPLKRAATLIEAGTWNGAFAEADVTVTPPAGDRTPYRIVRNGTALRLVPATGTLLIVR